MHGKIDSTKTLHLFKLLMKTAKKYQEIVFRIMFYKILFI